MKINTKNLFYPINFLIIVCFVLIGMAIFSLSGITQTISTAFYNYTVQDLPQGEVAGEYEVRIAASGQMTVQASQKFQTIDGFGASLQDLQDKDWRGHFYPEGLRARIADLAVNELGMSVGRIQYPHNVEQKVVSHGQDSEGNWITEYFKENDNNDPFVADTAFFHERIDYWNDKPDITLMQEFKKLGMNRFQMYAYDMDRWLKTTNANRSAPCKEPTEFRQGHYCMYEGDELAEQASALIKEFSGRGLNIEWFSPVNEPDVGPVYEWYQSMIPIIDLFQDRFQKEGISTTIVAPETAGVKRHYWVTEINRDKTRISYAAFHQYPPAFADPEKAAYVEDLKKVGELDVPKRMQTEFSNFYAAGGAEHLQDTYEEGLLTAWHMHQGMVLANFNAWMWWGLMDNSHAIESEKDNPMMGHYYPRGRGQRLIWIIPKGKNANVEDCIWKSPKYWAFRMFSRFVRPGMVRYGVTGVPSSLRVSAYSKNGETTVVIINTKRAVQSMPEIKFNGINPKTGFYRYVYSEDNMAGKSSSRINLSGNTLSDNFSIPGRSIVTYSTIDDGIAPRDIPAGELPSSGTGSSGGDNGSGSGSGDSGDTGNGDSGNGGNGSQTQPYLTSDFNQDFKIDIIDFGILLSHWNRELNKGNIHIPIVGHTHLAQLLSCWGNPSQDSKPECWDLGN